MLALAHSKVAHSSTFILLCNHLLRVFFKPHVTLKEHFSAFIAVELK